MLAHHSDASKLNILPETRGTTEACAVPAAAANAALLQQQHGKTCALKCKVHEGPGSFTNCSNGLKSMLCCNNTAFWCAIVHACGGRFGHNGICGSFGHLPRSRFDACTLQSTRHYTRFREHLSIQHTHATVLPRAPGFPRNAKFLSAVD
jgi:hypothetical protein